METSFRLGILHISDLHEHAERERDTWRRSRVLGDAWTKNLREISSACRIDLVCFTGDIADWGKKSEFDAATSFIDLTLGELSLDRSRLFLVPGNHDIDRSKEQDTLLRFRERLASFDNLCIARWAEGIAQESIAPDLLVGILSRQENYRQWLESLGRADLLPGTCHPNLGYRVAVSGLVDGPEAKIHVIGLDSAWLCGDDNDAEKIRLTDAQVGRLCSKQNGDALEGFRLALVHHPLDHLFEAEAARRQLGERVDLLLRGHRHQPNLALWSDDHKQLRELAAGCLYEANQADHFPSGCTVIEVDLDAQSRPLSYNVWFRAWSKNGHWHDDDSQYEGTKSGRIKITVDGTVPRPDLWRLPFSLPENYVPRRQSLEGIISRIRTSEVTLLWGTGGFGKTTLALAAILTLEIQEAFPDGLLWVTLGEDTAVPTPQLQDLLVRLTGKRNHYSTQEALVSALVSALEHRRSLIVLDDVWHVASLRPFLLGGPHCARLITTRDQSLAPENASVFEVAVLSDFEAETLLLSRIEGSVPASAVSEMSKRLGNWPLLLNLVNRAVRESVRQGQDANQALSWVGSVLTEAGLTAFDARNPVQRSEAVEKALAVSFSLLSDEELKRYEELAVFPQEAEVPLEIVRALWASNTGWNDTKSEMLWRFLRRIALLQDLHLGRRSLRLHAVLREYLTHRHAESLRSLHERLLETLAPDRRDWASLAPQDEFAWDNLAYHLLSAGHEAELEDLLLSSRYLAAKSLHRGPLSVELDFAALRKHTGDAYNLEALEREFIGSSHLLRELHNTSDRAVLLQSRSPNLLRFPVDDSKIIRLRPWVSFPDLDFTSRGSRTIRSASPLNCLCTEPSGESLFGGARNGTITKWSLSSGELEYELEAHRSPVCDCSLSRDGKILVSCDEKGLVCVWDTTSKQLLGHWQSDSGNQARCVIDPSGHSVFTFGNTKSLRQWNLRTGEETSHAWEGLITVGAFCLSRNGFAISAPFSDRSVLVWATQDSKLIATLPNLFPISQIEVDINRQRILTVQLGLALKLFDLRTSKVLYQAKIDLFSRISLSSDSSYFAFANEKHSVVVVAMDSGKVIRELPLPATSVTSVVLTKSQESVASATIDGAIRIDSLLARSNQGSVSALWSCEVGWGGRMAASAADDGSLLFWNLQEPQQEPRRVQLFSKAAVDCAVSSDPDGQVLVAGSRDGHMAVISLEEGSTLLIKQVELKDGESEFDRGITCCDLSADQAFAAFGTKKHLEIWDVATREQIHLLEGHTFWISDCIFLPRRQVIVSASWDQTIRAWSLVSGTQLAVLDDHRHGVTSVNSSRDGTRLVSTSRDTTIRLWSTKDWKPISVLQTNDDGLSDANFSPDGRYLAVTSTKGVLTVWSVAEGRPLTTLPVAGPLHRCAWLPSGERLIAAGSLGLYFFEVI